MFRFTIRDVLWLTVVVALGVGWAINGVRQRARIQALEGVVEVEGREIFPPGWEGRTAAMRNERAVLKYRVKTLTHELAKRGYRVDFGEPTVFVDAPPR